MGTNQNTDKFNSVTQNAIDIIRPLAKVVAEVLWGLNKGDRKKRVSVGLA
ncbi:MAG: hypothetical protein KME25_33355 [Symplocastrum torsivum CPER-KK1]|uniref:Uncharacterized protein n=1 Tax=Symplocastrum torsivum CPER-KK1 TaxID=450513 RepID=A0A951PT05_9CYAN|nr:hypothetical protein [Symplocastrum torsivum CPER-KK1]